MASKRKIYLVLFNEKLPKGIMAAKHSMIDENQFQVLMQQDDATITRKDGAKYTVRDRRLFEYKELDGSITLFVVCDAIKLKP